MYAGHAALALVLKARRADVPMLALALAAYGPDFIELVLVSVGRGNSAVWSHSLPSIAIGALIAGALYTVVSRRPGGAAVALAWLLHWPLDFVTGLKPLIGASPTVGLDLYHHLSLDLLIESAFVVTACTVLARRVAPRAHERRVIILLGSSLIVMQLMAAAVIASIDGRVWSPSLALVK